MNAHAAPTTLSSAHWGVVTLGLSLLAAVSLAWIWVISTSVTFDPPQWSRVAGSSLLPVGLAGAAVAGALARRSEDRMLGLVGVVVAVATVVGFVVLYTRYGG